MSNLSENLKKIRKDNNLSQEQLAEKLGVSRQAISKWESNLAYPEMDKTIQIANMFNLNIDDLLNSDIREVKNEKESKNNINKCIDDFLSFITDTVNLFSSMSFKSKIKCLMEQIIITIILIIIGLIIGSILYHIYSNIVWDLPFSYFYKITSILQGIYTIFAIIVGTVILTHIFKTRYLDYYEKMKEVPNKQKQEEKLVEKINQQVEANPNLFDKKKRINLKDTEKTIIIRDPKHSEYRFITALLKLIIGFIKGFILLAALFLCFTLICCVFLSILSFLLIKTGLFFFGILLLEISCITVNIIILLLFLNFIFNRKSNKKRMIQIFILSIILFGIGCGITMIGIMQFDYIKIVESSLYQKDEMIINMEENMYFNNYYLDDNTSYVIEDRNNIRLEFEQNKYCDIKKEYDDNGGYHLWSDCINPFSMVRGYIKDIGNKKFYNLDTNIYNLTIYTSKENIELLKKNRKMYFDSIHQENNYYDKLFELENQINSYELKIKELEETINSYEQNEEKEEN